VDGHFVAIVARLVDVLGFFVFVEVEFGEFWVVAVVKECVLDVAEG